MNIHVYLAAERGNTNRLAAVLGISGSLVSQWSRGKPVSAERCTEIERATGMAVRRWDLRPADWHLVWPELIDTEGAPPIAVAETVDAGHAS